MRAVVLLLGLAATLTSAASIQWTGIAGDFLWKNKINWYPAQVPGENDDVTIPSGVVQVTDSAQVNSLNMGYDVNNPANVTLFQPFAVGNGGLQVNSNGNLIINTGTAQVYAVATIGGSLTFIDGALVGSWTVTSRATADLGNANAKFFIGCIFSSEGQLSLGGVITLNQSSTFTLKSPTSVNTDLIVQALDKTPVLFDASSTTLTYSTGVFTVQAPVKLGTFVLQSGNVSILDSLAFGSSLNIPSGSVVEALGNAVLNATNGVTGAGVLSLSSGMANVGQLAFGGVVDMIGGAAIVTSASSIRELNIKGGNAVFEGLTTVGDLNLLTGTTAGSAAVVATNVFVSTKGLTLGNAITVNTTATFAASTLTFGASGAFTIAATATATATGALLLTGPAYIPGVTNNGAFVANAAVSSQNINIVGSGTISVAATATLLVNTATITQSAVTLASGSSFTGSTTFLTLGKVISGAGGDVTAVLGDYTLVCEKQCKSVSTPAPTTPTAPFSFTA